MAALDLIIEAPSMAAGVRIYYRAQPDFYKHGLAAIIPFIMAAVVTGTGVALYHVMRRMEGRGAHLSSVVVIPIAAVGILVLTQWPLMIALHSNATMIVVWISAIFAIAVTVAAIGAAFSSVPTTDESHEPFANRLGRRRGGHGIPDTVHPQYGTEVGFVRAAE
ncbi:hypothetical protein ACWF9G_18955 [Nocardia sp. NPDC055029]